MASGINQKQTSSPSYFSYSTSSQAYRNFVHSIKSESTKKDYLIALKYFMLYVKVENVDHLLIPDPKLIQSNIIDFIVYLKNTKKLAPASIATYVASIHHFYDINEVELKWKKINSFRGEFYTVVEDRPYTRQEIERLLEKAEVRNRAIILLMCSSGMRVGAIPSLKIKDLVSIDKYLIYQITVYKRSKHEYKTFCTPECRKQIDSYLNWRQQLGEKLNDNSSLFRKNFNLRDEVQIQNAQPISVWTIHSFLNQLLNQTGVRPVQKMTENQISPKRTEIMQAHACRKFFETQAIKAGLNPLYTKILMGHDTGLEESYFKPSPEDLLEGNDKMLGYVSIIDALTINEENRLKLENKKIKHRNDILEEERHEIISLQKQLEPLLALKNTLIKEGILRES
jgi:integrase